ncbi:arsenate reductase ArsC [bacterium]|nr:arsenate reductase ArsC [bacterium]
MPRKDSVLFLCGSNSCRSQMAEGLLKSLPGSTFDVHSAGATASFVHPLAIKVMAEIGFDISEQRSKSLDEFIGQKFDYVITVCAKDKNQQCPYFPGAAKLRLTWGLEDPATAQGDDAQKLKVFRKVRDELLSQINEFLNANLQSQGSSVSPQT